MGFQSMEMMPKRDEKAITPSGYREEELACGRVGEMGRKVWA
jgi:hypothetical protein